MTQVWGALLIFIICPLLGGLPLIQWITYGLTRRNLAQLGTGNISVSAAFYHGGTLVGVLAVLSEALKGIAAVLLARQFFPTQPQWEIIALIALVLGRYWLGRGAGTTNVVWGYLVHDWVTAALVFLVGGISFTILRERRSGKLGVLLLLSLMTVLRHPQNGPLIVATIVLCGLIAWIYQTIPDDLELSDSNVQTSSRKLFRFFQGDRSLLTLNQPLQVSQVGQKAATLSQLKRWGYAVPDGWVLRAGDDPSTLVEVAQPLPERPLIVRSSAIGEDSETASAAGQYQSILNITSSAALEQAIFHCQASYNLPSAARYRHDRGLADTEMAVLVQRQIQGVVSGVAFSRDPVMRDTEAIVIEALPGMAVRVVSGQFTPQYYRVWLEGTESILSVIRQGQPANQQGCNPQTFASWNPDSLPESITCRVEGEGQTPHWLIQQVAFLVRQLEARFHGVPQDIEWTYDGQQVWILQARPITTLLPIWTRKIAAEVIPGYIHPLTWSINRPLTCGVWGEIFSLVLGDRASDLNFNDTATLHHSAAYFNASLLGQIFRRMGLPPESLEFLTRGAKFTKPPLRSTLRNLPGLLRLLQQELKLEKEFEQDLAHGFEPSLDELTRQSIDQLTADALLRRIYRILKLLKQATYYSILAPLSAALRQAVFNVPESQLTYNLMPEVASLQALQQLAAQARIVLPSLQQVTPQTSDVVFSTLSAHPSGQAIVRQFNQFLEQYGYLSEVATDIAVPTWKENPQPARDLFTQFVFNPPKSLHPSGTDASNAPSWKTRQVQRRLDLKGRVTAVYSRLLAELRWSVVSLEEHWRSTGLLAETGDLFFLTFDEIEHLVTGTRSELRRQIPDLIRQRRAQLESDRQRSPAMLVYGNTPPSQPNAHDRVSSGKQLQGIGASPGQIEGQVKVLRSLQQSSEITKTTILVVPYTDSGWAPLLAQAGGLVAEVGGQLSHGAIVAREYKIPAVMDVEQATQRFQDGQRIRLDGQRGIVELLD
ncbi:glycerol-3-phosphate acyltransferase [Thermocoleostomius sinensis]|uniref:Glycerol-3-phosphate acyltransferase n=1 Tax=Thermocoleostomius sinensis A174 TaxID=2016057 RepID=A0A9E8ZFW9_9CYAN|nr:glycerol-3-phosphate acyltransferase [Thermocoleostomius sinensis]WAL62317.1 glycerol-3-phosphate acyltransferase [Thermocoleostomius sinensis A174]